MLNISSMLIRNKMTKLILNVHMLGYQIDTDNEPIKNLKAIMFLSIGVDISLHSASVYKLFTASSFIDAYICLF